MKNIAAIVLAAGKGTRMKSALPKVLHPILGRPMIYYTACLLNKLKIDGFFVVGAGKEKVKQALGEFNIRFITQKEQLGTGHAVKIALPKITGYNNVLILHGDSSAFFQPQTIASLISSHKKQKATMSILTIQKESCDGSGMIFRNEKSQVVKNLETKGKTYYNCEVNVGVFCVDFFWLKQNILSLPKHQDSSEYYFPDMIEIASCQKKKVIAVALNNAWEKTHINTPEQLKYANQLAKKYLKI